MATSNRNLQLEADLQASRQADGRKALILASVIGLISAVSLVGNASDVLGGSVPAMGRAAVSVLGLAAAVMMRVHPRNGWLLAMAWAVVQIPFYAWTPDGSVTAQAIQMPLTMTSSSRINGQLVSYSAVGINAVGILFVAWINFWKEKFGR